MNFKIMTKSVLAKSAQILRNAISRQVQLQIPLPSYPSTLISGQIPPIYLPLDV
eukprot:Pgem_evm1s6974